MKLTYSPLELQMEYPFGISSYTRNSHTTVMTKIEYEGFTGYGEGSPMRYLNETAGSICSFLKKLKLERFNDPQKIMEIMRYVDELSPGNTAAKTSVDIALHDLVGKLLNKPCFSMFDAVPDKMPLTTLTIGIDTKELVRKKVREATQFKMFKIKLGSDHDKQIIEAVLKETSLPLCIDANQGWKDRRQALDMICWLHEKGVVFIEQPMDKNDHDSNAWITENSPLPVIADEAMQRLSGLQSLKGIYSGINIKLGKSTGMFEASNIIKKARELEMKVMIGCTTETSCGIMAGAALAPYCDWADLDATWLITNNPFKNPEMAEGKIQLSQQPGLGLVLV